MWEQKRKDRGKIKLEPGEYVVFELAKGFSWKRNCSIFGGIKKYYCIIRLVEGPDRYPQGEYFLNVSVKLSEQMKLRGFPGKATGYKLIRENKFYYELQPLILVGDQYVAGKIITNKKKDKIMPKIAEVTKQNATQISTGNLPAMVQTSEDTLGKLVADETITNMVIQEHLEAYQGILDKLSDLDTKTAAILACGVVVEVTARSNMNIALGKTKTFSVCHSDRVEKQAEQLKLLKEELALRQQ